MPKWLQIEVGSGDEQEAQVRPKGGRARSSESGESGGRISTGSALVKGVLGLVVVAAVAGLGLLAGRMLGMGQSTPTPAPGRALAIVDGVPVTPRQVDAEMTVQLVLRERINGQSLVGAEAEAAFRREIVDRLVDRQLVLNDAAAQGMVLTEEEIAAGMPQIGASFNVETEFLRQAMLNSQYGLDEEAWRAWAAQQVLLTRYLGSPRANEMVMQSLTTVGRSADPVSAMAAMLFRDASVQFTIDGEVVDAAREGMPAPDFTLPSPDGQPMKLSDFRGQAVMVNFWATWCVPCRVEMPLFLNAYETNRNGLVILGVNSQETPAQVVPYVQQAGLTFPIVIDDGSAASVYRVRALPTTFFIDAEGMLVRAHRGAIRSRPDLKPFIEEIFPAVQLGGLLDGADRESLLAFAPRAWLGALR